ncbi:hypothetical protein ACA910_007711 [Epithemia clementina (nom. ined.)]
MVPLPHRPNPLRSGAVAFAQLKGLRQQQRQPPPSPRREYCTTTSLSSSSSSLSSSSIGRTIEPLDHLVLPNDSPPSPSPPRSVAIVGGGLAGLATAYGLLEKAVQQQRRQEHGPTAAAEEEFTLTVWDTTAYPGQGGASAVAGGLVHPLSPRGKLVHWGLEGLQASNRLIDLACAAVAAADASMDDPSNHNHNNDKNSNNHNNHTINNTINNNTIVLCDSIVRLATTPTQVEQLQQTAQELPQYCQWMNADEAHASLLLLLSNNNSQQGVVLGALRLTNGCRVIHVPSYLQGLWRACQQLVLSPPQPSPPRIRLEWKQIAPPSSSSSSPSSHASLLLQEQLKEYDTVVWCAGAAIFQDYYLPQPIHNPKKASPPPPPPLFPIQMVRGQSIEFISRESHDTKRLLALPHALLCGKYVSPLPPVLVPDRRDNNNSPRCCWHARVLVGATHEFQATPSSAQHVVEDLQRATEFMAPRLWSNGDTDKNNTSNQKDSKDNDNDSTCPYEIHRITMGYRVQSQRGKYGRLPLLGKLTSDLLGPPSLRQEPPPQSHLPRNDAPQALVDENNNNNNNHHQPKAWIFTGLSSRGLLYHALCAERLVEAIWTNDETTLMDRYPELAWWKTFATTNHNHHNHKNKNKNDPAATAAAATIAPPVSKS